VAWGKSGHYNHRCGDKRLINWFQAVKIKIQPKAFILPTLTPKKSRNMSQFFLVGIFFLRHSEEVSVDLFTSTVCGLTEIKAPTPR
jgi:hypothetical protein